MVLLFLIQHFEYLKVKSMAMDIWETFINIYNEEVGYFFTNKTFKHVMIL